MTDEIAPPAPAPDPTLNEISGRLAAIGEQNAHIINTLDAIKAYGDKRQLNAKIVDFNMPFSALIGLMIKIALASIPALIILVIIGAVLSFFFSAFFLAFVSGMGG